MSAPSNSSIAIAQWATSATQEAFTIHYFASASQHTGRDTERLLAPLALNRLFTSLEQLYPGFETVLKSCALSLNGEYVDPDEEPQRLIAVGDEVAIIPPVSSG